MFWPKDRIPRVTTRLLDTTYCVGTSQVPRASPCPSCEWQYTNWLTRVLLGLFTLKRVQAHFLWEGLPECSCNCYISNKYYIAALVSLNLLKTVFIWLPCNLLVLSLQDFCLSWLILLHLFISVNHMCVLYVYCIPVLFITESSIMPYGSRAE